MPFWNNFSEKSASLGRWATALKWPVNVDPAHPEDISCLELFIDFAISFGTVAPVNVNQCSGPGHRAIYALPDENFSVQVASATLAQQSRVWIRFFKWVLAVQGETKVFPASFVKHGKHLDPLGYSLWLPGVDRRPLLVSSDRPFEVSPNPVRERCFAKGYPFAHLRFLQFLPRIW